MVDQKEHTLDKVRHTVAQETVIFMVTKRMFLFKRKKVEKRFE